MMGTGVEVMIGLDVGTTAVKVVAFERRAGADALQTPRILAEAEREYPLAQPQPGWQVQAPAAVLAALDAALAECVGRVAASDGVTILGLSVSTAMHALIGLDAAAQPITPIITWADSRASAQARAIRESGRASELLALTGTPVHPMSPLTKLMWFREHDSALAARAHWWVGLKDLVLAHLTGQLVTELSSASATGLLDLASRDWSPVALDLAGIRAEQLPEVLSTTSVLALTAQAAQRVGLPAGLSVAVGAADGPLGNLGTGAIAAGTVGLSVGTSGAVRMPVPAPVLDASGRLFCYALTDEVWVVGGAVSNGGFAVRWAGERFAPEVAAGPSGDVDLLALAAEVAPGSDGLVMLPYLLSERAPLWDPDLDGAYLGLRQHHHGGHFVRAALEGVCQQVALIVDDLDAVAPVALVRATGGPFRSALWREVMAATLGRPLAVASDVGGTALGAAALGLVALEATPTLTSALIQLGGPGPEDPGEVVAVATSAVEQYGALRARIPALIGALGAVADLYAHRGDR